MSELEKALIEALEKEDIHITQQSNGGYMATWPSRYGGRDRATGRPNLLDSATRSTLVGAVIAAIRNQKSIEYWRGKKDALNQAISSLQVIAQEVHRESPLKKPTDGELGNGPS